MSICTLSKFFIFDSLLKEEYRNALLLLMFANLYYYTTVEFVWYSSLLSHQFHNIKSQFTNLHINLTLPLYTEL